MLLWIVVILLVLWLLGALGHATERVEVPGGTYSLGGLLVVIIILFVIFKLLGLI